MARKLTYQGQALLLGALFVAAWWVVPLVLKSFVRTSFFEFQAPSWVGTSYLKDLQSYWSDRNHSKSELIEAGVEISRLAAAYELRNQQATAMEAENRALERLLDLPTLPRHRYEVARVIRRDMNGWWQQLTIRKGRRDGIRPGLAVVYLDGVVGRVKEVHAYTSVVELLTSPSFRVAAHFENDFRPMQFIGGENPGLSNPSGLLSNVPADLVLKPNEPLRVVSSRLGGVFPDGLTLGYVDALRHESTGLFQNADVRINATLLSVREVAVLIPLEEELPEEETTSR
jgi:rod shape-determining protein MreC